MEEQSIIGELLTRSIPSTLWHYTSLQGFHGILQSKSIYATDSRYLNDSEEVVHAHNLISRVLEDVPEKLGAFPVRDHVRGQIYSSTLGHDRLGIFVASFSESEDQLGQWRGYSYGSAGASLGFDLRGIRPALGYQKDFVFFAACVYEPERKKELVRYAVNHLVEMMEVTSGSKNTMTPNEIRQRAAEAANKTVWDLIRIIALLKSEAFQEEREWRLVWPVPANVPPPANIIYRTSPTSLIPTIPYKLPQKSDKSFSLVDVILGPGSHPHAFDAALSFIQAEGVRIKPRHSKVPYRPK